MILNQNINNLVTKYNENKLSHIFLIETNNKDLVVKDIINLIKVINCAEKYEENCNKCNICHLIETNTLPNLKIIYPDGQVIKKEQMEELKNNFACIPIITKFNTYIITDASKFNASSANTILKFIEEPEPNIIGFLITNNKENVIETIKSRCELIKVNYEQENLQTKNINFDLINDYLWKIEIEKKYSIFYSKLLLDKEFEREDYIEIFKYILDFYKNLLDNKCNIPNFINNFKGNIKNILEKIKIVSNVLEKLNYNVNINLVLDYFVLSLEECY